jgi:hypothetical protein
MRYNVVWESSAEHDLTTLWLGSRIRFAISRAADQIDTELSRAPHDCGESREVGKRVMFVWPLGVSFEINDNQNEVRVISVWQI